jgi:hypothetical protein
MSVTVYRRCAYTDTRQATRALQGLLEQVARRKRKRDEKTPSGNAGKKPLLAPPEERVKVSSCGQSFLVFMELM